MTLPNQPQPPGKPVLRRDTPALDQQPERPDVRHSGVDGTPLAPLKRTATMPNMAALKAPPLFEQADPPLPVPPALPAEHARTVPAAAHVAPTQPARTPATGTVAVRPVVEIENPSSGRQGDREAILLEELAKARGELAKRDRDDRAAAEAKLQTYPPKVAQPRSVSPVPSSAPSRTDAAIGKVVRTNAARLAERFGLMPLLVVFGLGGGAAAVVRPAASPEKLDALMVRVTELETRASNEAERRARAEDYARELARVTRCLRKQQAGVNASILPAPDHFGAAKKQQPWDDVCPDDPKPP